MMKNSIFLFIVILFISYTTYSQWTKDSTLANTGPYASISTPDYNIAWVAGNQNSPVIYRTTNGGIDWASIPTNGIPNNSGLYSLYAVNANTAYVGDGSGDAHVYKTTNAGANWISIYNTGGTSGFFNGIEFSRSNPLIGIAQSDPPTGPGNNYYIQKTTDGGTTWNLLNPAPPGTSGYASSQHSPFIIDANFFGFGYDNGGFVKITKNGGTSWATTYVGRSGFVSGLSFNTDKLNGMVAVNQSGLSKTTDGGVTWTNISVNGIDGSFLSFCYWIPGTNIVYASASGAGIKRSTDAGATWVSLNTAGITDIRHMDFVTYNNLIYGYAIAGDGTVLNIMENLGPLPVQMTYFNSKTTDNNIILSWETAVEINNSGFNVERSQNGINWENTSFVKGNGNKTSPTDYQYTDKYLQKGTYKYRLKQIDYNGNFEYFNLNSDAIVGVPASCELYQNYPNPSNPSTKINFKLMFSGHASLKIYDIAGREVAILVDGTLESGYYQFNFNGNNISSGVYFYKLKVQGEGQNYTKTMKMLLIK